MPFGEALLDQPELMVQAFMVMESEHAAYQADEAKRRKKK